jgi:hypothetical protein
MVTAILAFATSLLCALSIAIIELFHMDHRKQQNMHLPLFWSTADTVADTIDSLLNTDDPQPDNMV